MLLGKSFYMRDRVTVAKEMVGKLLVVETENGRTVQRISETEAYGFEDDTACHAHKGRTKRTETLYMEGGTVYVYLCYGMHWLLNIVTGEKESPQAVLIRACVDAAGPGKLTKKAGVTGEFNQTDATGSGKLWLEDDGARFEMIPDKRVGIGYASQEDQDKLWRFKMGKRIK